MLQQRCQPAREEFVKAQLKVEEDLGRPDLQLISAETLVEVLRSAERHNYVIVDARFPYEFAGGHIPGSMNAPLTTDLQSLLPRLPSHCALVFHCEFSEYRAPSLCRWLRNEDRRANIENFPHLNWPNLYVLKGGYAEFFGKFQELCEPHGYVEMREEAWKRERKQYMERVRRDRGKSLGHW